MGPQALGSASSPEEANDSLEDGRTEDVGTTVLAGCKTPPGLQPGKESLDCDACATASCCNGLVSCGSDGARCKA